MQAANNDAKLIIQVPASPETVALRHAAARKAGLDPSVMPGLSFDWVPAPKEAATKREAFNPHHPGGIYKPQHTRPLSSEEWTSISDLLVDQPFAKLTYRKFLNDILRYVISGWSWRDVGYGQHYPASRERVRRKRGLPVWSQVAARVEQWGDREMVSHMLRVCQWLADPSNMSLIAVTPTRRFRSKAQLAAEQKKRSEYVYSDKVP